MNPFPNESSPRSSHASGRSFRTVHDSEFVVPKQQRLRFVTAITLLRILLVILLVCITDLAPNDISPGQALLFFFCLGLIYATDVIDGHLARKWRVTSKLGYLLDGYADRLVYYALTLLLVEISYIPLWLALLVLARDLAIYAARSYYSNWDSQGEVRRHRRGSNLHAAFMRTVLSLAVAIHVLEGVMSIPLASSALVRYSLIIWLGATLALSYWLLLRQVVAYHGEGGHLVADRT
jgi:phosphatidylglycerophosphate synthase